MTDPDVLVTLYQPQSDLEYWQCAVRDHINCLNATIYRVSVAPATEYHTLGKAVQHAKSLAHALEQLEMYLSYQYREDE